MKFIERKELMPVVGKVFLNAFIWYKDWLESTSRMAKVIVRLE